MPDNRSEHICFYLPSLAGGGAEKLFIDLANHYGKAGLRVTIVCAKAEGPYLQRIRPEVELVDLKSSRVVFSIIPLWRYLGSENPDAIMANMSYANIALIIASMLPSRFNGRVIVEEVAQLERGRELRNAFRESIVMVLMKLLYTKADSVIGITKCISEQIGRMTRVGMDKIKTIPGLVDIKEITKHENEDQDHPWLSEKQVPVIIAIGRFLPEKDFHSLLKAFSKLRERRSARLIILGEGKQRPELEELAIELKISEDVSMPGFTNNPGAFLSRSDLFVLSSRFEGFGIVVIEAMAVGCNVVTTDCSTGPIDIVGNGQYGTVVPVGDVDAMATAMEYRLDNPIDSEALRARAREFDINPVGGKSVV